MNYRTLALLLIFITLLNLVESNLDSSILRSRSLRALRKTKKEKKKTSPKVRHEKEKSIEQKTVNDGTENSDNRDMEPDSSGGGSYTPRTSVTYHERCSHIYKSIVEALKSIGVDSSFKNRQKIAALNGIKNYKGTAEQNISLLNKLKSGKLIENYSNKKSDLRVKIDHGIDNPIDQKQHSTIQPKFTGITNQLYMGLKKIGIDPSFDNRKKIAALNGIPNYTGAINQNIALLNKLKSGKLNTNFPNSDFNQQKSFDLNRENSFEVMDRLKESKSYKNKIDVLVKMGTVLLKQGYENSFVAGILANIYAEGKIGLFEDSRYKNNKEPSYLKIMDNLYNYNNKYANKIVTEVSLSELKRLVEKLKKSNWENGKFGIGCVQWTAERTKKIIDLYIKYANGNDKITYLQASQAEAEMIGTELASNYNYVYNNWKSKYSGNLNSAGAAYGAGSTVCLNYESPYNKEKKAAERAKIAQEIYNKMMGK